MSVQLYEVAKSFLGVKEPNSIIRTFFKEGCGMSADYRTHWCSAFTNYVARRAGFERTGSAAALSWNRIGRRVSINEVMKGDVVVWYRGNNPAQGHVGFFGEWVGNGKFTAISGNYGQAVKNAKFTTGKTGSLRFIGFRRLSSAGFSGAMQNVEDSVNGWGNENIINPAKNFFNPNDISTNVKQNAYQKVSGDTKYQPTKIKPLPRMKIKDVKKVPAAGIWSIVKFVSDRYSLSQTVNDASLNNNQGSLLNFVQKVIQKPWLQFRGTTIGNRYYFYSRKEPFDYEGWQKIPTLERIEEKQVLSDNLSWYDGDVYSWFQLTPRGNFYTEQHLQFGYVTSVFFEEYADIWGSKPMSQVSNYVNYYKVPDEEKDIMHKKATLDLKYMVESNSYLPFTRKGSITILGNTSIKAGYKIEFVSTQEIYYVDGVTHNYSNSEGDVNFTTTLQVSRGMKKKYIGFAKNKKSISYFNLINFDTEFKQEQGVKEEYRKPVVKWKVNREVFDFFLNKKQNG